MKKLLFLFAFVAVLGCSGDDDSNHGFVQVPYNDNPDINPPLWTIGTWVNTSLLPNVHGHKFISHDYLSLAGGNQQSHQALIDMQRSVNPASVSVSEPIRSATEYRLVIVLGSATIDYHFKKVDGQEQLTVNNDGVIFTKQ